MYTVLLPPGVNRIAVNKYIDITINNIGRGEIIIIIIIIIIIYVITNSAVIFLSYTTAQVTRTTSM